MSEIDPTRITTRFGTRFATRFARLTPEPPACRGDPAERDEPVNRQSILEPIAKVTPKFALTSSTHVTSLLLTRKGLFPSVQLLLLFCGVGMEARPIHLSGPEVAKLDWNTRSLVTGDLNNDGLQDLALINNDRAKIEILGDVLFFL